MLSTKTMHGKMGRRTVRMVNQPTSPKSHPCQKKKKSYLKSPDSNRTWWCMPIVLVFGRLRQEDRDLEASLGYIARSYLK
jgi:hypothetical protein